MHAWQGFVVLHVSRCPCCKGLSRLQRRSGLTFVTSFQYTPCCCSLRSSPGASFVSPALLPDVFWDCFQNTLETSQVLGCDGCPSINTYRLKAAHRLAFLQLSQGLIPRVLRQLRSAANTRVKTSGSSTLTNMVITAGSGSHAPDRRLQLSLPVLRGQMLRARLHAAHRPVRHLVRCQATETADLEQPSTSDGAGSSSTARDSIHQVWNIPVVSCCQGFHLFADLLCKC